MGERRDDNRDDNRGDGGEADPPRDDLDAGDFGSWIAEIGEAIDGRGEADVPCGGCTACCTSSQFVHIAPEERRTLRRIPKALLFPAPRLAKGHMLMPYDERGHCPMLVDNACSIYNDRPQTCRTYDCRVFPASGLMVDEPSKVQIAQRARRWRFTYLSDDDAVRHQAARAAGRFLVEHPELLADLAVPPHPTQRAVLAVGVHRVFLGSDDSGVEGGGHLRLVSPTDAEVRAEIVRWLGDRSAGDV